MQELVCPNCGGKLDASQSNLLFCPFCGAKFKEEKQINVKIENVKFLDVDKLVENGETAIKAGDYEQLKKVAEEIRNIDGKNFYGWYFNLVAYKNNPVDGSMGRVLGGLNKFAMNFSAVNTSEKKQQRVEIFSKGSQALASLENDKFISSLQEAIKIASVDRNNEENAGKIFELLNELTTTSFQGIMAMRGNIWTGSLETPMVCQNFEKKYYEFFEKLLKMCVETQITEFKVFKQFFTANAEMIISGYSKFATKSQYRKALKKLILDFMTEENIGFVNKTKNGLAKLGFILAFIPPMMVPAIVINIIVLNKSKDEACDKSQAITGLCISSGFLVLFFIMLAII